MNTLTMMDLLIFESQNSAYIRAVEASFGALGQPLSKPDRLLLGQGRLMKKSRTRWQLKSFFLFNDVLVYGSVLPVLNWHKKQKIIALEDIQMEDTEDGFDVKNQWLIRTPRKSFYVAAASIQEKEAWMEHFKCCQANLLLDGSRQLGSTFAVTLIPDSAAMKCMRCFHKFSLTKRRHHCQKCGFLVCKPCSRGRVLLDDKCVRVCTKCYAESEEFRKFPQTGDDNGHDSWEEECITTCKRQGAMKKGAGIKGQGHLSAQLE